MSSIEELVSKAKQYVRVLGVKVLVEFYKRSEECLQLIEKLYEAEREGLTFQDFHKLVRELRDSLDALSMLSSKIASGVRELKPEDPLILLGLTLIETLSGTLLNARSGYGNAIPRIIDKLISLGPLNEKQQRTVTRLLATDLITVARFADLYSIIKAVREYVKLLLMFVEI